MRGDQWHGWSLRRAPGADATELLTHQMTIDGELVALANAPRVRSWLLLPPDTCEPTREGT